MRRRLILLLALGMLVSVAGPQAQDTRQVYLSPIDGSGTEADPWHSRCVGLPGAGNIDLRPYGVDAFLCASNSLPADMTGVDQIGASFKSSLGARKAALNAKLKATLVASTVEDLIVEIVRPKLRAGMDGKLRIYLGSSNPVYQQTAWVPFRDNGLVADIGNAAMAMVEPGLAWAASFADTFTGADGNLAGDLTWTEFLSTEWTRTSNAAFASGATAAAAEARADHDTATANHSVQADMAYTYVSSGNFRCAVLARKNSTTTRDFYQFGFQRDSGVNVYRLLERNAGSPTTLADSAGATAASATVKIISDGTSHAGYVNGVLTVGPVTDATITGNTRGGIAYVGGGASDNCTADNFLILDAVTRARGNSRWLP